MAKVKSAYEKLYDIYGTQAAIGSAFNLTPQGVSLWKFHGIPTNRALEVEKRTDGKLTAMDVLRG